MANLNRKPAQSIEMMREIMAWLKAQPRKVPLIAGASAAFGCSIDGVVTTAQTVALCKGLADAGVDEIMLADTVGYAHPAQIKEVVLATRAEIGPVRHAALPSEAMHGPMPNAGLPPTFRKAA